MEETQDILDARADALVEDHERLLDTLIEYRKHHNLTQLEVADRMGVTQPTVAGFERYDANPTLSTLRRYAMAVGARLETKVVDDCVSHNEVFTRFTRLVQNSGAGMPWPGPRPRTLTEWGNVTPAKVA